MILLKCVHSAAEQGNLSCFWCDVGTSQLLIVLLQKKKFAFVYQLAHPSPAWHQKAPAEAELLMTAE